MAILQVRDIDNHLYTTLKSAAKAEKRSLSQEVIVILRKYLSNPSLFQRSPTLDFLSLTGSWSDDRPADAIVAGIKEQRKNSRRFGARNALFD